MPLTAYTSSWSWPSQDSARSSSGTGLRRRRIRSRGSAGTLRAVLTGASRNPAIEDKNDRRKTRRAQQHRQPQHNWRAVRMHHAAHLHLPHWHQSDKPSRQEAAMRPAGCFSLLANDKRPPFQFTVNQDTGTFIHPRAETGTTPRARTGPAPKLSPQQERAADSLGGPFCWIETRNAAGGIRWRFRGISAKASR